MGYYINTEWVSTPNSVLIKKENYSDAYDNLCWLNTNPEFDILKSGGSFGGEDDARSSRPENMDYHPCKWFSWMPADYHKQAKTLIEILHMIGFDVEENEKGIESLSYSNKAGNEDIFLCALAAFIESDSEIAWAGEDGDKWKHVFKHGKMFWHQGKMVYSKQGQWFTLADQKRAKLKEQALLTKLFPKDKQ